MSKYLISRLISTVPTIVAISILVFSMLHFVPGDPVRAMFIDTGGVSQEQIDQIRSLLGLDLPVHVQYWKWVTRALRGDLGASIITHQSVTELIRLNFPSTLQLTLAGVTLAAVVGVTLGILAAIWHNSWIDNATMVLATISVSMPSFWLGLLLIYTFGIRLRWVPITAGSDLKRLALPAIALGLRSAAVIARLVRTSLLEIMQDDYIRTARAKGLGERAVIVRHALRNALIPLVTVIGLQFGWLLGGAVITEQVFARRGLGKLMIAALQARDFPMAQGTILFAGLVYVLVNLGVDVFYAYLDPRIRYA
jgi:ABC-type dipeptide/oligopeptide/nickel transport system permease component